MHKPTAIQILKNTIQLADADFEGSAMESKAIYRRKLNKLQERISHIQQAYYHQNKRAIIIFEGWDASGKGGVIRRLTEKLDPRGYRVIPISAPKPDEQSRHYLYRFQKELPKAGSMTIFDRSYYGRVLVERVEELISNKEWQRAYYEINEFERLLSDDGVCIIKIFLHITPEEQLQRLYERLHNPYKRWKVTEEDFRNRLRWKDYEKAINDMFKQTTTNIAAWHLIAANRKWYTRIQTLEIICAHLEKDVDIIPKPLDPKVIKAAEQMLSISDIKN
ncbi:Polyphosphate kinase 2, PPK2 family [Nitrosomonas cryotolerans]|uniref:Polyphosphate kinase 2, PPK2 family n=1 Tax=Nitrosomonas cryotolerans ATCC 49181 TaxID=1131553 RepID=A0A1N6HVR7_9PROT|nr:polyphosphate kinase [Nitrosomonas cryotolerans]SFQ11026.1 Polyphosphate kinase 2, PPK2 family [Nitrosomonas cryotolerans]SIO23948.1 Polyphosphate kinase 2, PPK2 family [Nitrosomonas cryotolerans ATCC 49181]